MDKKNLNREWLLRTSDRLNEEEKIVIPAALIFIAAAAFASGRGGKRPEGRPADMDRQIVERLYQRSLRAQEALNWRQL